MAQLNLDPTPFYRGTARPDMDWDDRIVELAHYWRSLAPVPQVPSRTQFNPADLVHLLPHLWLCDIELSPFRLAFRLVGTELTRFIGREVTGEDVKDVFAGFASSGLEADAHRIVNEGRPLVYAGPPVLNIEKSFMTLQRITLPFASDGRRVDKLLGLSLSEYSEGS